MKTMIRAIFLILLGGSIATSAQAESEMAEHMPNLKWAYKSQKRISSPSYSTPRYAPPRRVGRKAASQRYRAHRTGGPRPHVTAAAPATVRFLSGYKAGTIIIDTSGRRLYYVLGSSSAYSYPIAVGRRGFQWSGVKRISRVQNWPTWRPPAEMRRRQPDLPKVMTGGLYNPLGAKALYLGSSLYRIHGTHRARSIGSASSSGCFRMHNKHVVHLAQIAGVGTRVVVLRRLSKGVAESLPQATKRKSG